MVKMHTTEKSFRKQLKEMITYHYYQQNNSIKAMKEYENNNTYVIKNKTINFYQCLTTDYYTTGL